MAESKDNLVDKFLESIYNQGFEWRNDGCDSKNIFGLIRQIKKYTADMDRDEAIEQSVYAAVDFVKDGNL